MIKLGTNSIGKIYLGTNSIGKAYLGSDLVFQRGVTPGPSPVFYDFLIFDGVAKIQTTVTLPESCSIRCQLGSETLKAAQRVFRATTNGLIQLIYNSNTTSTDRHLAVYYDSTSVSGNATRAFSNTSMYFWMTPTKFGWGSTTANNLTKGSAHPTGGIELGGWDTGTPYTGKLGNVGIYGSDAQNATSYAELSNYTPVALLRPCTYNGEAGLWWVEGNQFFGNTAGSGTLTVQNDS